MILRGFKKLTKDIIFTKFLSKTVYGKGLIQFKRKCHPSVFLKNKGFQRTYKLAQPTASDALCLLNSLSEYSFVFKKNISVGHTLTLNVLNFRAVLNHSLKFSCFVGFNTKFTDSSLVSYSKFLQLYKYKSSSFLAADNRLHSSVNFNKQKLFLRVKKPVKGGFFCFSYGIVGFLSRFNFLASIADTDIDNDIDFKLLNFPLMRIYSYCKSFDFNYAGVSLFKIAYTAIKLRIIQPKRLHIKHKQFRLQKKRNKVLIKKKTIKLFFLTKKFY